MATKVKITPAEVVFGEATDRQRSVIATIGGGPQPPISQEEYIASQKMVSRPGVEIYEAIRHFCLARKDDADIVVSTCELHPRKAIISSYSCMKASEDGNTRVRIVDAYAISSVYTPPQYRGQGMASYLLRKVQEMVDEEGYECGVLYSDIGRDYYAKPGWRAFDARQLVIHLEHDVTGDDPTVPEAAQTKGDGGIGIFDNSGGCDVRPLKESDILPLCEVDIQNLSSRLDSLARINSTTTDDEEDGRKKIRYYVSLLPGYSQMAFHSFRDTYISEVLYTARGRTPPEMYHGATTSDKRSWVYWDHGMPHPESKRVLRILRVVVAPGDTSEKKLGDLEALLRAAVWEAKRCNLSGVVIWDPSPEVIQAAVTIRETSEDKKTKKGDKRNGWVKGVLVEDRKDEDGSIPCLRWSADFGHDPEGGEPDQSVKTIWVDNEAFGWC